MFPAFSFPIQKFHLDNIFFDLFTFCILVNMSRKTERLAKKANKKNTTPTVEKIEAAEESSDEEIPEAVAIEQDEEDNDEEESEIEEEEAISGDEEEEEQAEKKIRTIRPKINDEVNILYNITGCINLILLYFRLP
jgi:phage repressor protein C with HTH and peptisase S24 domain